MDNNTPGQSWKSTERVVAILEKILTPTAKVQHNVYLPVLGSHSGRKRQCDAVITFGEEPRQSIAIVEVQKRKEKPEIGEFHGWLTKMQEVGAQQLICVSEAGYPDSVIEYAATRIGPTVKLMTLSELEHVQDPRQIIWALPLIVDAVTRTIEVQEACIMSLEGFAATASIQLDNDEKAFSIGQGSTRLSLNELIQNAFNTTCPPSAQEEEPIGPYSVGLVFTSKNDLWFHHNEQHNRVLNWPVVARITPERHHHELSIAQLAYRQQFRDGVMAWVATIKIPLGREERELLFVFKPDSRGYLVAVAPMSSGQSNTIDFELPKNV